jgi:hypothetical protein
LATGSQRVWRAACPNCGAPVEFASAASASAVCSFCRSTLLRDGEALRRIGQSAELFDDHSPLQLQAAGKLEGHAFTIVGRQQIGYEGGSWNEWHILLDHPGSESGFSSAWLSEDNGAYVVAAEQPLTGPVPTPDELFPGQRRVVSGAVWDVASLQRAKVLAAEGELPVPPRLDGGEFFVADLRNQQDQVGTLDWRDPQRPSWTVGRSVRLADLALTGLRGQGVGGTEKTLRGQAMNCPNCGASLEPKLDSTKSIVCSQCEAVVDISKGAGADLEHYVQQSHGTPPLIPLGRSGKIALGPAGTPAIDWQVVGYVERIEVDVEAGEEQATWREYLLYNATEGFTFLVDAEDGWSYARPITGVPQIQDRRVIWRGKSYDQLYSYSGAVTHVLGEFYWRLSRGEKTRNTDFAAGALRLNREQAGQEVTWSAGGALDSDAVAKAFGLGTAEALAMRRDTKAFASTSGGAKGLKTWLIVFIVAIVLFSIIGSCSSSSDDCQPLRENFGEASAEYQQCLRGQRSGGGFRTGGGSYGGFSSGGGHK